MGEYVININWSSGGREKSKTNTYQEETSLLPTAVLAGTFDQNSLSPDTLYGISDLQDEDGQEAREWRKIHQNVVLSLVHRFF